MKQREAEQKVLEKIQREMEKAGIRVSIKEKIQNNGARKRGIVFQQGDIPVAPIVYFDENIRNIEEVEKQVEEMKNIVQNSFEETVFRLEKKLLNGNWEHMKDKIVFKLVKKKGNEEFLKQIVYKDVLDLALVFYILLEDEEVAGSINITSSLLDMLKISEKEVYDIAKENTPRILPSEFIDMRTIIKSSIGQETESDEMYVLRNVSEINGAGTILYDGVLEKIAERLNGNFYIIPCSVHECIIVRESSADKESLDCMIKQINSTALKREEVLENHAYLYDRERKKIMY